jgi:hypothetical protein
MNKLLLALLVAALMLSWGFGGRQAHANAGATVDFYIEVATAGCDTDDGSTTCNVDVGTTFTVSTYIDSFSLPDNDTDLTNGYVSFQVRLNHSSGLARNERAGTGELDGFWPECAFAFENAGTDTYGGACISGYMPPLPESTFIGKVMEVDYDCTASPSTGNTVTIVHEAPGSSYIMDDATPGQAVVDSDGSETLTINCNEPTAGGVGGIVQMQVNGSDSPASLAEGSGSSSPPYGALAGAAAAGALAVVAGAWYARRRWVSTNSQNAKR